MQHFDTIVIGAGLAGLNAARTLADGGQSVLVLEARDRVGGRTETITAGDGTPVDVGGQWVGPTQTAVLALIDELGIATFPQHMAGRHQVRIGERQRSYRGSIPALSPPALVDLQLNIWRIDRLARTLSPETPAEHRHAAAWDNLTLASWLGRKIHTRHARAMLVAATRAVFAKDPDEISLLQFLFYVRSAGGLMPLIEADNGAQDRRIDGGAQQLSQGLAARLQAAGGELRPATPVQHLEYGSWGVRVTVAGEQLTAARAIVAMAPAACTRIAFSPELPPPRNRLAANMPMGSVIKCVAIYNRAFWRAAGQSGQSVSDTGPLTMTFDDSPADTRHGALVGFILGSAARRWSARDPEDRRAAVCHQLADTFGDAANRPVEFIEKDWCTDEWADGCYVGLMRPGAMTELAPLLRQPVGPIHWAGTETATTWNGYMDGALRSGSRAAEEVLTGLNC